MQRFIISTFCLLLGYCTFGQDGITEATNYYEAGDYAMALQILDEALADDHNAEGLFLRGNCHHKLDQYDAAAADYDFAIKQGIQNEEIFLNRAICRISLGWNQQAETDLWRYAESFPDDPTLHYYLGVIDYMLFDNKESLSHLQDAVAMQPNYYEAHYLIGANYAEMKKWKSAEESYRKVLKYNPEHDESRLNVGVLLLEHMDYESAVEEMKPLRESEVNKDGEVDFFLAEAYFALKLTDEACDCWKSAGEEGDMDAYKNYKNVCEKGNEKRKQRKRVYAEF